MNLDGYAIVLGIAVSYFQHTVWMLGVFSPWLRTRQSAVWAFAALGAILAAWMTRGWLGELSALNTIWSTALLFAAWRAQARAVLPKAVAVSIVLLGVALYPSALHLVRFDVYALGYFAPISVGFIALAAGAWWAGHRLWGWGIVIGVALWAMGVRHSPNLWDMLLDVPLWVTALASLVVRKRKIPETP